MNCATHPNATAVAYCRTCGKPLCSNCVRDVRGAMFCEQCLADRIGTALPPPPAPGAVNTPLPVAERLPSPGMAAVLGFIPGVGAMYNGQFMKGFLHVMAFVCLIWMADHFGPIMIPVFFAYFFYLVFDAYKKYAKNTGIMMGPKWSAIQIRHTKAITCRKPFMNWPLYMAPTPGMNPSTAAMPGLGSRSATGSGVLTAPGAGGGGSAVPIRSARHCSQNMAPRTSRTQLLHSGFPQVRQ